MPKGTVVSHKKCMVKDLTGEIPMRKCIQKVTPIKRLTGVAPKMKGVATIIKRTVIVATETAKRNKKFQKELFKFSSF